MQMELLIEEISKQFEDEALVKKKAKDEKVLNISKQVDKESNSSPIKN